MKTIRPFRLTFSRLPAALALGLAPTLLFAEVVMFQPQAPLISGTNPLAPGIQAVPCVTDWNGDGLKDLLVGYRNTDKVAFYGNCGTDAQPVFTNFVNLRAGGVDIVQPGSSCGGPAPWVCDWDGDGRRDLLVGNGANGQVFFYANTNTDAAPLLAPGVALRVGASVLSVGARATPFVHDWDQDGLPDLLCGDSSGYANFFKNNGTRQAPSYATAVHLRAGGTDVNFGARSAVRVLDWDGDGLQDLVGSGSGYAGWCRNVGSNPNPILSAKQTFVAPVSGSGLVNINTSYRMRLEVVDWNNDGLLDLLVGDSTGPVFLFTGYRFALTGVAVTPGGAASLRWHSANFLRYDVLAGGEAASLGAVAATGIVSGGVSTCWTNNLPAAQQFYRVRLAQ